MNKEIELEILTPYGKYYSGTVDQIKVHSEDFYLGITPNHSPLITSLVISKMILIQNNEEKIYAISGGILDFKDGKAKMLLNSIESKEDIDIDRALKAKQRAEERLLKSEQVDINKAKIALKRALNRIDIYHL